MYSDTSIQNQLKTLDESLVYLLLEGPGMVEIDVTIVEHYFIPIVSFLPTEHAPRIQYGAIVRNKTDVLGAESMPELLDLLSDLYGQATNLKFMFGALAGTAGPH